MNCSSLFRTWVLAGLTAIASLSQQVRAASLTDLQAFTQSAGATKRVFSDRTVQSNYRKTLERYIPKAAPSAQDFEKVWEQLAKLRKNVGPVNERLMAERKPMAIQYSGKPFYRFERVQPLHSVWLLESMREPETTCGPRDSLLVDRWTPLLQDAAFFALEKDGKFTGSSVVMVPVRNGSSTFMLVSVGDRSAPIPPKLLAAFLRDYRTREPRALPYALLSKDKGAYRMNRVDANGNSAGALGPVEGFQLVDPTARRITDAVPTRCATKSIATNSAPSAREVAAMAQPTAPITINVNPGNGTSNYSGAAESAAPGNAKATPAPAAPSAQDKKLQNAPGGEKLPSPVSNNGGLGKPVVNSIVNNNQFSPKVQNGTDYPPPQLVDLGGRDRGPASLGGSPPITRGNGAAPLTVNAPTSVANAGSGSGSASGSNSASGSGASAQANPQQNNHYTPNDRRLADAIQAGRKALDENKAVPKGTIENIARGSFITQDPELRKEAQRSISELYYKGDPIKAYQELRQVQENRPDEARNLIHQLNKDLCTYCSDCAYCKALKARREGLKNQ
jgi:hypothetical protein